LPEPGEEQEVVLRPPGGRDAAEVDHRLRAPPEVREPPRTTSFDASSSPERKTVLDGPGRAGP
jgi:hypothetical protein